MNRRRGYSLIEMLVVIATGATMMGIALGLLHLLFRAEQGSREEVRERSVMNRLATQFRLDVHAAERFSDPIAPGGDDPRPGWQFPLAADHVVEYRAGQGELVRTERADGKLLAQESFDLPAGTAVSIDLAGDSAPGIVSLRILADAQQRPGAIRRGLHVDAALAKDRRFVKHEEP